MLPSGLILHEDIREKQSGGNCLLWCRDGHRMKVTKLTPTSPKVIFRSMCAICFNLLALWAPSPFLAKQPTVTIPSVMTPHEREHVSPPFGANRKAGGDVVDAHAHDGAKSSECF